MIPGTLLPYSLLFTLLEDPSDRETLSTFFSNYKAFYNSIHPQMEIVGPCVFLIIGIPFNL